MSQVFGLILVAIGLVTIIGWEFTAPDAPMLVEPARPPTMAAVVASEPDHLRYFAEINARPLFNTDRRPIANTLTGLPRLTGIIVSGTHRYALFAGSKPLTEGEQVGKYRIQKIDLDGVIMLGPEGVSNVRPRFDAALPDKTPQTHSARPAAPSTTSQQEAVKQERPRRPTLTHPK